MFKCPRIHSVEVIDNFILLVKFENQEQRIYDVSRLLEKEMFAPLKNPVFFKSFTVDTGGYAVIWNEDLDISEYELWKNGTVPVGQPSNP